jgi:hypothetical protein
MSMVNPFDAPDGFVAVEGAGCQGCAFNPENVDSNGQDCPMYSRCCSGNRDDGANVIFVKRLVVQTNQEAMDRKATTSVETVAVSPVQHTGYSARIVPQAHYELAPPGTAKIEHVMKGMVAMVNAVVGDRMTSLNGIPEHLHYLFKKVE